IVFAITPDPVGADFVDSLTQPGGNVTGFMLFEYSLSGKWLELLKEPLIVVPMAVALPTTKKPLALIVVSMAVLPLLPTKKKAPALIVVSMAKPWKKTSRVPPLLIVVPLAVPWPKAAGWKKPSSLVQGWGAVQPALN